MALGLGLAVLILSSLAIATPALAEPPTTTGTIAVTLHVTDSATSPILPLTGEDLSWLLVALAALILAGTVALFAYRKKAKGRKVFITTSALVFALALFGAGSLQVSAAQSGFAGGGGGL
ncbi:MAG: LPXTG cell wall anchor domain-containing protein [Coriobacteriales bacterium]|nr:LPXTG cell wall anchor domain-containing protein [Coriobacteriales bacterium]